MVFYCFGISLLLSLYSISRVSAIRRHLHDIGTTTCLHIYMSRSPLRQTYTKAATQTPRPGQIFLFSPGPISLNASVES